MKQMKKIIGLLFICSVMTMTACSSIENIEKVGYEANISIESVPEYNGEPYVAVNNNEPEFADEELTTKSFETYSSLDADGRCGVVQASIGRDLMPTEKRGNIGQVKPSGWKTAKYDHVDGKYLYNRCHLIGYQLTAENANEKNLITGTRYMNVEGMLPFENMVADYVKETSNHVMYRVTPIFEGDNLVASGVQMEAESVEDSGEGISFNVFVYNVQPGVEIDYATGDSWQVGEASTPGKKDKKAAYILNTNNMKFHKPDCTSVKEMKESNKKSYKGKRSDVVKQGYEPCRRCKP